MATLSFASEERRQGWLAFSFFFTLFVYVNHIYIYLYAVGVRVSVVEIQVDMFVSVIFAAVCCCCWWWWWWFSPAARPLMFLPARATWVKGGEKKKWRDKMQKREGCAVLYDVKWARLGPIETRPKQTTELHSCSSPFRLLKKHSLVYSFAYFRVCVFGA